MKNESDPSRFNIDTPEKRRLELGFDVMTSLLRSLDQQPDDQITPPQDIAN